MRQYNDCDCDCDRHKSKKVARMRSQQTKKKLKCFVAHNYYFIIVLLLASKIIRNNGTAASLLLCKRLDFLCILNFVVRGVWYSVLQCVAVCCNCGYGVATIIRLLKL